MRRTYKLFWIPAGIVFVVSCAALFGNALLQESEDMMMKMSSPREIIRIDRQEVGKDSRRPPLTTYWVLTNGGELKQFTQAGRDTEPVLISSPPSLDESEWKEEYNDFGGGKFPPLKREPKPTYRYTDDQASMLFRKVLKLHKRSEENK